MTTTTRLPIPPDLAHDELVEWLAGAGFDLATNLASGNGWRSQVFTARLRTKGWPTLVGVVVDPQGGWAVTAEQVPDDYDELHEYGFDCDCDECREARAEHAALRRVGM